MKRVPVKEASRSLRAIIDLAQTEPVVIEKRGAPRAVVLSMAHLTICARLCQRYQHEEDLQCLTGAFDDFEEDRPGRAWRKLARLRRRLAAAT